MSAMADCRLQIADCRAYGRAPRAVGAGRLVLLGAAVLGLAVAGCSRGRQTAQPTKARPAAGGKTRGGAGAEKTPRYGLITLKGTTLTGADAQGDILWRAEAKRVDFDESAERADLDGVACTFVEEGKDVSCFRAGKMTVHFAGSDRRLLLTGKVHAESLASQAVADFDRVTYLWDRKRLVDAAPVELTKGSARLVGTLLEGDVALRRVRIVGKPAALSVQQATVAKTRAFREEGDREP